MVSSQIISLMNDALAVVRPQRSEAPFDASLPMPITHVYSSRSLVTELLPTPQPDVGAPLASTAMLLGRCFRESRHAFGVLSLPPTNTRNHHLRYVFAANAWRSGRSWFGVECNNYEAAWSSRSQLSVRNTSDSLLFRACLWMPLWSQQCVSLVSGRSFPFWTERQWTICSSLLPLFHLRGLSQFSTKSVQWCTNNVIKGSESEKHENGNSTFSKVVRFASYLQRNLFVTTPSRWPFKSNSRAHFSPSIILKTSDGACFRAGVYRAFQGLRFWPGWCQGRWLFSRLCSAFSMVTLQEFPYPLASTPFTILADWGKMSAALSSGAKVSEFHNFCPISKMHKIFSSFLKSVLVFSFFLVSSFPFLDLLLFVFPKCF